MYGSCKRENVLCNQAPLNQANKFTSAAIMLHSQQKTEGRSCSRLLEKLRVDHHRGARLRQHKFINNTPSPSTFSIDPLPIHHGLTPRFF